MNKEFVKQWENNKHKLEDWFKNAKMDYDYTKIVKKLFEVVLKPVCTWQDSFDVEKMTVIDDGDYQGYQLFLVPFDTYQPDPDAYAVTYQSYGSCSGCDALESITNYDDGKPDEEQLKDLMMLALHLVQNAKMIYQQD